MRAYRSFTVRARLPKDLAPLHELAMNLRWAWDSRTRDLFRWVEPDVWESTGHDPIRLLGLVGRRAIRPDVHRGVPDHSSTGFQPRSGDAGRWKDKEVNPLEYVAE